MTPNSVSDHVQRFGLDLHLRQSEHATKRCVPVGANIETEVEAVIVTDVCLTSILMTNAVVGLGFEDWKRRCIYAFEAVLKGIPVLQYPIVHECKHRVRGKLPDEDMGWSFNAQSTSWPAKRYRHRWKFGCGASYADQEPLQRMQAIKWQMLHTTNTTALFSVENYSTADDRRVSHCREATNAARVERPLPPQKTTSGAAVEAQDVACPAKP